MLARHVSDLHLVNLVAVLDEDRTATFFISMSDRRRGHIEKVIRKNLCEVMVTFMSAIVSEAIICPSRQLRHQCILPL